MLRLRSLFLLGTLCLTATSLGCAVETTDTAEDELGSSALAATPKRTAPDQIPDAENTALWKRYCLATGTKLSPPAPNYENAEVKAAATQLSRIAKHSYAIYRTMLSRHKPGAPPAGVTQEAHEFLVYLCGEFRDRATMVQAKLKWVARMNYLDDAPTAFDPKGDPWAQMKKADYAPYLRLSSAVFYAKQSQLSTSGQSSLRVGNITTEAPIPPQTVCETKYMLARYVKANKTFDSYTAYQAGYNSFRTVNCQLPQDEDYYYDFRGDSNIKPNSPESNAMIWFSDTLASQCMAYDKPRAGSPITKDMCETYYRYPFTSRWNAARAGLATWVLVDPTTLSSYQNYTTYPRSIAKDNYFFGDLGPFKSKGPLGDTQLLANWKDSWGQGDFGIGRLLGSQEKLQRILQIAVDRHTDWYTSKYDDEMPKARNAKTQAYSPFVASSYEMSESDAFTSPGYTVKTSDPTAKLHKHFMYVFRVHKDNWFTPRQVIANKSPDFDRAWLDETSFGNSSLANGEKAWDRMGTALESELDTILYLHNITK